MAPPSDRRYLAGASASGLLNVVGSALATVLLLPFFIRAVGLDGYALWATIPFFVGVGSLADLGTSKALVVLLPKASDEAERSETFSVGVAVSAILCLAMLTGLWGLYALGVPVLGEGSVLEPEQALSASLAGSLVLASTMCAAPLRAGLEACFLISVVNVGYLILTVGSYAAALIAFEVWRSPTAALNASAGVYGVVAVLHVLAVGMLTDLRLRRPVPRRVRSVVAESLRFFRVALPNASLLPLNRFLLLTWAGTPDAYGLFDIFSRIGGLALSGIQAVTTPLLALFSSKDARGEALATGRLLRRFTGIAAGLYLAGTAAFVVAGAPLLAFVLDRPATGWERISAVVVLAGVASFGVAEPTVRWFLAKGWTRLAFVIQLLQPAANLGLLAALASAPILVRFSAAYAGAFACSAAVFVLVAAVKLRRSVLEVR